MRLRRWSVRIFYLSAALYVISFFFAFLLSRIIGISRAFAVPDFAHFVSSLFITVNRQGFDGGVRN